MKTNNPIGVGLIATGVFAVVAVAGTMASGVTSYSSFISIGGLLIVIGGCVANSFMSYQREEVISAFHAVRDMFKKPAITRENLHKDIMQLIMWAYVIQAHDFIGLEKETSKKVKDPMLAYGLDLVVTGYSSDTVRQMMNTVTEAEYERRIVPIAVLRNMAATAPAFGMVGTLIGMVTILKNIGGDIPSIGGGLAVAMLATLYGLLVARLVCLPAADKMLQREDMERFRNNIRTEGLAMLAEKRNPIYMQDRMNSFLQPSKHLDISHYSRLLAPRRTQPSLAVA